MTEKRRILFVDDEEAVLRFLKRALEQAGGYEVATEQNGKRALQTVREFKPQMIFMDISMTDLDGPSAVYEIRSDVEFAHVPIVFLTGAVSPEEVARAEEGKIGGQLFLAKPIDPKAVVNCIEKHLGPKPA